MAKNEKQEKVKKEVKPTTVSFIVDVLSKGQENKQKAVDAVFDTMQKQGITTNQKGKEIKKEKILSLMNAFMRDVKSERKGHWSKYQIAENEKEIKLTLK